MQTSVDWSACLTSESILSSHDQDKWPELQKAVRGAQSSLVNKALQLLNRSPLGEIRSPSGRVSPLPCVARPPELATLETPPSSCVIPFEDEIDPLLKPPTVPSQAEQASPNLVHKSATMEPSEHRSGRVGDAGPIHVTVNTSFAPEWFFPPGPARDLGMDQKMVLPIAGGRLAEPSHSTTACPSSAEVHGSAFGLRAGFAANDCFGSLAPVIKQEDPVGFYDLLFTDDQHYRYRSEGSEMCPASSGSETSLASDDWSSMIDLTGAGETPAGCDAHLAAPMVDRSLAPGGELEALVSCGNEGGQQDSSSPAPFKKGSFQSAMLDPYRMSLYHSPSRTVLPASILPKTPEKVGSKPSTMSTPPLLLNLDAAGCSKGFASSCELDQHKAVHKRPRKQLHEAATDMCRAKPSLKPVELGPQTPLKCSYPGCAKVFSSMHNLSEHRQVHTFPRARTYLCTVSGCGGRYFYKRDLQRHTRKKHPSLVARSDPCRAMSVTKQRGSRLVGV